MLDFPRIHIVYSVSVVCQIALYRCNAAENISIDTIIEGQINVIER